MITQKVIIIICVGAMGISALKIGLHLSAGPYRGRFSLKSHWEAGMPVCYSNMPNSDA